MLSAELLCVICDVVRNFLLSATLFACACLDAPRLLQMKFNQHWNKREPCPQDSERQLEATGKAIDNLLPNQDGGSESLLSATSRQDAVADNSRNLDLEQQGLTSSIAFPLPRLAAGDFCRPAGTFTAQNMACACKTCACNASNHLSSPLGQAMNASSGSCDLQVDV